MVYYNVCHVEKVLIENRAVQARLVKRQQRENSINVI